MEQASLVYPQYIKKIPEGEEQRFHKYPFAVILIVKEVVL